VPSGPSRESHCIRHYEFNAQAASQAGIVFDVDIDIVNGSCLCILSGLVATHARPYLTAALRKMDLEQHFVVTKRARLIRIGAKVTGVGRAETSVVHVPAVDELNQDQHQDEDFEAAIEVVLAQPHLEARIDDIAHDFG
jgi:hypothetical protein